MTHGFLIDFHVFFNNNNNNNKKKKKKKKKKKNLDCGVVLLSEKRL